MTVTDATERSPAPATGVRIALFILGVIELLKSAPAVGVLLDDDPGIPGSTLGGLVISGTIVLIPIMALAAAVLAFRGRAAQAIVALAAIVILAWLGDLVSVVRHWASFPSPGIIGAIELVRFIAFPLLAAAAIVLATRRQRLGLAALCVAFPTIFDILGVIAFGVGVALHGF